MITDDGQVPAVTATRYALRHDAPVPALSGASGNGSNGHAVNGNGSHVSNGHSSNGHSSNGHSSSGNARPAAAPLAETGGWTDAAGIPPVQDKTGDAALSGMSDDSGWWTRPTLASDVTAESIQAGHVMSSATELVSDHNGNPPTAIGDDGELPVRVRQANLAPELRNGNPANVGPAAAATSAEEVRDTMSAIQRGWELGRSVAAGSTDDATSYPGAPKHRANREEA